MVSFVASAIRVTWTKATGSFPEAQAHNYLKTLKYPFLYKLGMGGGVRPPLSNTSDGNAEKTWFSPQESCSSKKFERDNCKSN